MIFARRSLLLALPGMPAVARAQAAWRPDRPVRAIVPFAPGGGTDVLARVASEAAAAQLGQAIVVDNRPGGAAGLVGTEQVARAAPDGQTILINSAAHVIAPALVARMPYDPIADFAGVAMLGYVPQVLVVNPNNPATTLAGLVAQLRARPGQHYASSGIGSAVHLAGEIFRSAAGVDVQPVHYRGSGPAMQGVLAGEAVFSVDALTSAVGLIRGGAVRALAVSAPQRSPALPDVPTSAEAGLPGFVIRAWIAALAPARTPEPVLAALNAAYNGGARQIAARLAELGVGPMPDVRTPAEIMDYLRQDLERSIAIMRAAGVRPE